jgi:hypothetical protein
MLKHRARLQDDFARQRRAIEQITEEIKLRAKQIALAKVRGLTAFDATRLGIPRKRS